MMLPVSFQLMLFCLASLIPLGVIADVFLGFDEAFLFSWGGTLVIVFGFFAYAVIFDPMRRWPGSSVGHRALNILLFRR